MILRQFKTCIFRLPCPTTSFGPRYTTSYFCDQKRTFRTTLRASAETWVTEEASRHQTPVHTRARKPVTNIPFIKNLFLGKFDTVGIFTDSLHIAPCQVY